MHKVCLKDLAATFAVFNAVLYLSHKDLYMEFYAICCALIK